MSEWWTYRLSDFLMFSPATYWRMVALYHRDIWPLQLLAAGAGVVCLALAARPRPAGARIVCGLLAVLWLWVGWAFHAQRFATINWAASWFAIAFAAQAVLLVPAAAVAPRRPLTVDAAPSPLARAGWLLAAVAILLYPMAGLLADRPITQADLFGITPDPTTLATLGLLLALREPLPGGWRWLLSLIPLLAAAIGAATLWTMRSG